MIVLLDRGEEGIHVHKCNGAGPGFVALGSGFGMIHMKIDASSADCATSSYCDYIQYMWWWAYICFFVDFKILFVLEFECSALVFNYMTNKEEIGYDR